MYIEGRKKKLFSEKLVAELTLFILIRMDQAILLQNYLAEFGGISERTVYRYIDEIEVCGYSPRIRLEAGEITVGSYEYLEREEEPRAGSDHIRRLNRILQIYERYSDACYDVLYPNGGLHGDGISGEPVSLNISSVEVLETLKKLHPEDAVDKRTVQRDMTVLTNALEHYRRFYGADK